MFNLIKSILKTNKDSLPLQKKDILFSSFPKKLQKDVLAVLNILPTNSSNQGISHQFQIVQLNNETLSIPNRIYFSEPGQKDEDILTETQKTILNCLYSRHHNGYIRQKRLLSIVSKKDSWITPFTITLLGEYIYEIIEILEKHINNNFNNYRAFIKENDTYWRTIQSRVISYWNEYYRERFPVLQEYLGVKIIASLNSSK